MSRTRFRAVALPLALLAATLAAGALLVSTAGLRGDDNNEKKDEDAKGPPALRLLGEGREAAGGPREPSGVAYHPTLKHLFAVGDEGSLFELDTAGTVVGSRTLEGNLEDVAVLPAGGVLLLLVESPPELVALEKGAGDGARRIRLDTAALLGEKPRDAARGFEGLTVREDPSLPGGGMLYLVHQAGPAMLVALAADALAASSIGAQAVRGRFRPDCANATAVTWVSRLDRLLVLCESSDRIIVMDADGKVHGAIAVPGVQQEGLAFDGQGNLWIADDRAGKLVRYAGALGAFTVGLKPTRPAKPRPRAR